MLLRSIVCTGCYYITDVVDDSMFKVKAKARHRRDGATEIAGVDNVARSKKQGWTTRE